VLDQLANNNLIDMQGAHKIVKYWYVLCVTIVHIYEFIKQEMLFLNR